MDEAYAASTVPVKNFLKLFGPDVWKISKPKNFKKLKRFMVIFIKTVKFFETDVIKKILEIGHRSSTRRRPEFPNVTLRGWRKYFCIPSMSHPFQWTSKFLSFFPSYGRFPHLLVKFRGRKYWLIYKEGLKKPIKQ